MDIRAGDILEMKKCHPGCGSDKMKAIRVGADIKLSCVGCGHMIMMPRVKCEKSVKRVIRDAADEKR